MKPFQRIAVVTASALVLFGCTHKPKNPNDPYEKFNRTIYAFNDGVDHAVVRPLTRLYRALLPGPIRRGISNAFKNTEDLAAIPNDLLQGKMSFFLHDTMRLVMNTTIGLGGVMDVATKVGLDKHEQGFGMTLAYYSPKGSKSPYLVLPFLGPHTFRSAFGRFGNLYTQPISWVKHDSVRIPILVGYILSTRDKLMPMNNLLDNAFDSYALVRNAYLQRRAQELKINREETTPKAQKERKKVESQAREDAIAAEDAAIAHITPNDTDLAKKDQKEQSDVAKKGKTDALVGTQSVKPTAKGTQKKPVKQASSNSKKQAL